jgi:O-antigen/teichoic acid export membrane protein
MSASKRIALAVAFSWLSRAVAILANLFLMPILFRFMGKEELGLWFLLGNSQAFLGLLGLGIAPTLMRHIALAKGKNGADPEVELSQESKQHIGDLVVTGRIILQWLAVIVFFIAWGSGYGLIGQLELKDVSPQTVFWAWTLMCAGYAVGVWVSYLNCWLAGIGYVGWDSLIGTVISLLTILANIGTVLLGGGLLALATISVGSSIAQRLAILGFIRWRKPELLAVQGRCNVQYAKAMIKPSLYSWLTSLGAFLILRTDSYFIALLKGAENIPTYQAGYQLVSNLYQLAVAFGAASSVFISQAWQAGNLNVVHQITLRNARMGLSIMAAGVAFLLVAGKELMNLWLGQDNFVGYQILLVFCIMLTLESQHVILVNSSRATEDEKYAPLALTAGILNFIFTWVLIKPLGLLGVAIGTMLAQMLTNNWYAVYRPIVRLKLNFGVYLRQVVGLWGSVFVCCLGFSWLAKQGLMLSGITSNGLIVVVTTAVCGVIFLYVLWRVILEKYHRERIQAKIAGFMKLNSGRV